MMFQVFKSAVGHSIFGGSVIIHWQAQWIWTLKKIAMSDSQAFCVCFLLSLFFKYHECWIFGRRKPLIVHICVQVQGPTMCASARNMMLRSTDHVCKFKERYHPHPTPTHPMTCVAPTMCASARNVTIPTPPHPNPMTCVAPTMCASARNVIIPTPPHPNPMTCVAPTMCASARNVIIPTPPHPNPMTCIAPTMCASARNVIIPTPPHPMTCVAPTMCASSRNVTIPTPPHPNPTPTSYI